MAIIGSAISIIIPAVAAAISIGLSVKAGVEAIARQPEKAGEIRSLAFLGMVLAEACAIYGLLIAFLLFSKI